MDAFSARLKQSGVSVQVARVAVGNWFQNKYLCQYNYHFLCVNQSYVISLVCLMGTEARHGLRS